MKHLLSEKDVVCVGEIMNYRQIIQENHLEITKFLNYLKTERPGYVIEGHCPSLVDLELAKFLYLGINGDHTEHTLEEVKQRIENGMFFEIQEKRLKEDVIQYIKENQLYEYCAFVTDDTMADTLLQKGQLNYVTEQAIKKGFPLEEAIYCSTYTPSRRMQLYDRGVKAITMPVKDGLIQWQDSGCLLAMVLERHGKHGRIGYGFLTGACHKKGTAATTYFHDHHNLFVAGNNPHDMRLAVERIRALQGGFLTIQNGKILSELPLPVCGILSDQSVECVGTELRKVRESLRALGYCHANPIMSFATLGLPVSPALKLTDKGLVDVKNCRLVNLVI